MLDALIGWLKEIWSGLMPWAIVKEYSKGVKLRFGRFQGILEPGFHWIWPLVDDVEHCVHVTTTMDLPAQSVLTSDGESIVIKCVVKYSITDVEKFYCKVTDAVGALRDISMGSVYDVVKTMDWDTIRQADLPSLMTKEVRKQAFRWGITVESVTVSDLAKMKSIRLIGGSLPL